MSNLVELNLLAETNGFKIIKVSSDIGVVSDVVSSSTNFVAVQKFNIIKESNKPIPDKQIIIINGITIKVLFSEKLINSNRNIELMFTASKLINFDDMAECIKSVIKLI